MRVTFNLDKRYFSFLLLVVLIGFAIAQTPPNPGHDSASIVASGVGFTGAYPVFPNNNLNTWLGVLANSVNSLDTRLNVLEANSCPSGMADAGDFCIDTTKRLGGLGYNWHLASVYCGQLGFHLCSGREWVAGCWQAQGAAGWGSAQGEWAGDITTAGSANIDRAVRYGITSSSTASFADCHKTVVNTPITDLYSFRCCKSQ